MSIKSRKKSKKILAAFLVAAMLLSFMLPVTAAEGDVEIPFSLDSKVLDLKFDESLDDSSDLGNNASLMSGTASYIDGVSGKALSLSGSQYLSLGTTQTLQPEDLTLSFWINPGDTALSGEDTIMWNKAAYNADGWYLVSPANTILELSVGPNASQPYKAMVDTDMTRDEFFPVNTWTHIVVTYSSAEKTATYYRNGVKLSTKYDYTGASGVIGKTDATKCIGMNGTNYNGSFLSAALDEYKLYEGVATELDVLYLFNEFETATMPSEDDIVLDLGFDGTIADASTYNHPTALSTGSASYAAGYDGTADSAIQFTGNQHISLGTSTELQPEDVTVAFWINRGSNSWSGEQIFAWTKANYNTPGWYLGSPSASNKLVFSVGIGTGGSGTGQPLEGYIDTTLTRDELFPQNEWVHVAASYDSSDRSIHFFINGLEVGTRYSNTNANGYITTSGSTKYIGRNGTHNNTLLNATLDEYKIYKSDFDYKDAVGFYESYGKTADKVSAAQRDLDALNIPTVASTNISLPTTGKYNSSIIWKSSNEAYLSSTGKVTRPATAFGDVEVELTAYSRFIDGTYVERKYTVTVLAQRDVNYDLSPTTVMGDVELNDNYLVNASNKETEYLLSLSSEKFLYEFYRVAGLTPTTEEGYEGWERAHSNNFRSHTFGHYMSALSQAYISTDDAVQKEALLDEIRAAVEGLAACQQAYASKYPEHAGYISAFPERRLNSVDGVSWSGEPNADLGGYTLVPYYNLHKVYAGLIDIAKNVDDVEISKAAFTVVEAFGEYLYTRLISKGASKSQTLGTEYGGMNESFYELYRITGNDHFKAVAEFFDETSLFTPLSNNQDVLNGKHANTTIPKFTGAMKRYVVMKENPEYYATLTETEKTQLENLYLKACVNFWDIVVNNHTYVTGGDSQGEHFREPGKLHKYATQSGANAETCETCNTYNMLKFTRLLYQVTGDVKYMDYFERTYTNAILPSQSPETGTTMYFQPMAPGYNKVYNRPFDEFWCCTGTGMENFSKLGDAVFNVFDDGIAVNMFYASSISNEEKNVKIIQDTNVPNSDVSTYIIESLDGTAVAEGTALKLRKPDWLAADATIKLNGEEISPSLVNGYYVIDNISDGDVVEYTTPMEVVPYATPDKESFIAFKYGPVVLSTVLSTDNYDASQGTGILVRRGVLNTSVKTTIALDGTLSGWLDNLQENFYRIEDSEDGYVQFKLKNVDQEAQELIFTPHYTVHNATYGLYMYYVEPDSEEAQKLILEQKEKARYDNYYIDYLFTFDNNNYEADKNVQSSSDSSVGSYNSRTFRHATSGGWFSYDLKVDPAADQNYLHCTYTTADVGRSFDIYINGTFFKKVVVNNAAGTNVFYADIDEIPASFLTTGDKITVKFQSNGNNFVGGLFGIATSAKTEYDTDARLESLTFDTGDLSPAFDSDVMTYELTVPASTESVSLNATPMLNSGLVYIKEAGKNRILIDDSIDRLVALTGDTTEFELITYAEDHTTYVTYKVTVTKEDPQEDLYLIGDVNGDEKISLKDVLTIQKYAAYMVEFTDVEEFVADVDKSGDVTLQDALLIQKWIIKLVASDYINTMQPMK